MRQMGGKQYRHQVTEDTTRQVQLKVTGEMDVTSVKDYMLVGKGHHHQTHTVLELLGIL